MQISFNKKYTVLGFFLSLLFTTFVILCNDASPNLHYIMLMGWAILTGLSVCPEIKITNPKIASYAIYGILILAALMGASLCLTENLWYDEGYTAALVAQSVKDILTVTSNDVHTPFYYLMAKGFYLLFGGHIQGLKVCSLFFYLCYLLLGAFPIRKEFGNRISFFFLFFSAMIPSFIMNATNARMYSAAIFFVTATGLLAYKITRKNTVVNWILFTLLSVCSVYIHTFALIATVMIYLFLLGYFIFKKEWRQILSFLISAVMVSLAFLPWLNVLWEQFQNRQSTPDLIVMETYDVVDFWAEWFSFYETPQPMALLFYLFLVVLLLYFAIDSFRQKKNLAILFGSLIFVFTVVIGVYLSVRITPCYLGRYSFPAFGFLCLLLALGASRISSVRLLLPLMITVMAVAFFHYKDNYHMDNDPGLQTYQDFVEQNMTPEDGIVFTEQHTQYLSVYYPEITNFIYGNKSPLNPFPNSSAYTSYEQLDSLPGNIWYVAFRDDTTHPMGEHYASELKLSFHYMYYDFDVFLLTPIGND